MRRYALHVCLFALVSIFLAGCGGGGGGIETPPAPTFTSMPPTAAEEGVAYSYTPAATVTGGSAVTFALTSGPVGATLSGDTVTWTPTHAESRTANTFTVTAMTAAGGSAAQNWSVTPNGNINITDIVSRWSSSGAANVPRVWSPGAAYPAALVPQADGSLTRLEGAVNPDGSFGIPNVPGGYVWLQVGPNAYYWIATSDFDFGEDLIETPIGVTPAATTTTFNYSISGLQPAQAGDYLSVQSGTGQLPLPVAGLFLPPGATSLNAAIPVTTILDWSQITTLFVSQYLATSTGAFTGITLGPSATLTGVTLTDGATNNITATLSPSPSASVPLSIQGTHWASEAAGIGPGVTGPNTSNYYLYAQPYLTDRLGANSYLTGSDGPDFTMLRPAPAQSRPLATILAGSCGSFVVPAGLPTPTFSLPAIVTDVNYGTLSYEDPFPATWQRLFEYCQFTTVSLPRPNSTTTDTFLLANRQVTAVPESQVSPIVGPVQNPMINGASIFQAATLATTSVDVSWGAPSVGQPFGYYVNVYQLGSQLNGGTEEYILVARLGTAKTSVQVPFLGAGNTYVFLITSDADGIAGMEKNPLRAKAPNGEAAVVSAPMVIAAGAAAKQ